MSTIISSLPRCALAGLAVSLTLGVAVGAEPRLGTNQPAPSLAGAHWARGGPFTNFIPGQLYVVEFHSSSNGAAPGGAPVLATLAQKYAGRHTFISVSLAAPGVDEAKRKADLAAFVRAQGPRLNYALGMDTADGRLAQAWLVAAGQTNLPVAFVVDKSGKVAWIGNPARGLDEALNASGAMALPGRLTERPPSPELELRRRVSELRRAGKLKEALAAVEEASAESPLVARSALPLRMSLLFQLDPAQAGEEARKLADGFFKSDPPSLAVLGGVLLTSRVPADKAYGLTLAQRAAEQTGYAEWNIIAVLARAQAANGNPTKSVEVLEAFAKKLESSGGANSPQSRAVQSELTRYRKEAKLPPAPAPEHPADITPR